MKISKIKKSFFDDNQGLVEILDKGENRGYGIAIVYISNCIKFGIPLRSNMRHKSGFKTVDQKGLDYSKAIIIPDDKYIDSVFNIPSDEYKKIQDTENFINKKFKKYVERYIKAINNKDENIIWEYRFSTLQNYHTELGCSDDTPSNN